MSGSGHEGGLKGVGNEIFYLDSGYMGTCSENVSCCVIKICVLFCMY